MTGSSASPASTAADAEHVRNSRDQMDSDWIDYSAPRVLPAVVDSVQGFQREWSIVGAVMSHSVCG